MNAECGMRSAKEKAKSLNPNIEIRNKFKIQIGSNTKGRTETRKAAEKTQAFIWRFLCFLSPAPHLCDKDF